MWRRGWGGAREDIGLRSNDGDAWHPTAPTTVLVSHSPEIPHHTPHHITSFLATSPDTSGTRDERVVPPRTPFGAHAPSARRCGRHDDVSSAPFRSDVTRLPSTTKASPQHPSVTSSPPQQPRDMTLPSLLPFVQANGWTVQETN